LAVQLLCEVAVAVEEPDADEGDAQIARGFEVVAREHAQTAGEHADALGNRELRREVGNARLLLPAEARAVPRLAPVDVVLQLLDCITDLCRVRLVARRGREPAAVDLHEQLHRVLARALPQVRIELTKEPARLAAPRPPQVV